MIREPKLEHYPAWLREKICDPFGNPRAYPGPGSDTELRRVHSMYHKDPTATILFDLAIQTIRYRFKIYKMEKKIEDLQNQINELKPTKARPAKTKRKV